MKWEIRKSYKCSACVIHGVLLLRLNQMLYLYAQDDEWNFFFCNILPEPKLRENAFNL